MLLLHLPKGFDMALRKNTNGRNYALFSISIDNIIIAPVDKLIKDRTILQSRSKYIESLILDDLKRRNITLDFNTPPPISSNSKALKSKSHKSRKSV